MLACLVLSPTAQILSKSNDSHQVFCIQICPNEMLMLKQEFMKSLFAHWAIKRQKDTLNITRGVEF